MYHLPCPLPAPETLGWPISLVKTGYLTQYKCCPRGPQILSNLCYTNLKTDKLLINRFCSQDNFGSSSLAQEAFLWMCLKSSFPETCPRWERWICAQVEQRCPPKHRTEEPSVCQTSALSYFIKNVISNQKTPSEHEWNWTPVNSWRVFSIWPEWTIFPYVASS